MRASAARNHLVALALPLALLGASFSVAPYLFELRLFPEPQFSHSIVPLYRHGSVTFYYTPKDLLHPESFGPPGRFIQVVAFDVWPAHEGAQRSLQQLTWVRQAARALAGLDKDGQPLAGAMDVEEEALASEFLKQYVGPARLPRGAVDVFHIPSNSTYHRRAGLDALIVLAVKDPGNDLLPSSRGAETRLDVALAEAFERTAVLGARGIGVPFIPIGDRVGHYQNRQRDAWLLLLRVLDQVAPKGRLTTVVLGGFGLRAENAAQTDQAFRQAYGGWWTTVADQRNPPTHEPPRLAALVAAFALVAAAWRREAFTIKRLLAICLTASVFSVSVASLHAWLAPILAPVLSEPAALAAKVALAGAAGVYMRQIASFDPRKLVSTAPDRNA